jgi:uncharacterized protein (DUF2236 family)
MGSETDQYADAAGLVARSAAAYASSVPTDPADDGFFGPASVTWRVSADLSSVVAGLRALLVQALHPLAMAGVDQHSDWRRDPVGRLAATSSYLATVSFGDRAAAERAAARVRRIHEHVRGTDPVTGRAYAASDPALLLWVHAVLVESNVATCQLFGTPLTPQDCDRYVGEMAVAAELVGVPAALIPASCAARPRPPRRRPTCSTRPAWIPTSRRSGRTSATGRPPRCRSGRSRCTAIARQET